MNKYKLFMIIGICILVITIGTTFALYVWQSDTNAIVNLNVCTPTVYFSGGETINGKNLIPVFNKEDGAKKEIEVRLNKSCDSTAFMNLYMRLDVLSPGLSDESFVYELYKGSTLITSGNFADKTEGDTLELTTNEVIDENSSIYMLYIYLDGNYDNPDTTQNQIFNFHLYSEGTGAIYKENVIREFTVVNDPNSAFLDTSVLRKDIQSIAIAKDNNVPEGVTNGTDISSLNDGSVMMWYTDEDNNNLYEVYIGGKNGIVKANANGHGMFSNLSNVTSIDLTNLDTSELTSTRSMFNGCTNLVNLKINSFDTSKVTSMQAMFSGCTKLTELNLSSFNTQKVTTMRTMFQNCSSLVSIDLSNFNTSLVRDMSYMFRGCSHLSSLDLSSFDTSSLLSMAYMFFICSNLEEVNLSNANTSNVTNMIYMFSGCSNLLELYLNKADFSKVANYTDLFAYVPYSTTIYVKDSVQKEWISSKFPNYSNIVY